MTAAALMLADLRRSGLTQADAKLMRVEAVPGKFAGYRIPYFDLRGKLTKFYRTRYVGDTLPQDKFGRDAKYIQPRGSAPKIYFPPNADRKKWNDIGTPLIVTEGEKKAYAATKVGFLCLGLGGVWAWRYAKRPLADFELVAWKGRTVAIVFDSDALTNDDIKRAETELAAELRKRGALVQIVRLPAADDGAKQGLDDFLVTHGARAFRALLKQQHEQTALEVVKLSDVEPERVEFLWFPYLPLGKLTLLEGDPGQGKSFISLQIAADLSRGRPLPGIKDSRTGGTLLLSAEDGLADTIAPRLAAMKADSRKIIAVPKPFTIDDDGLRGLDELLAKHRPALVIIDPLVSYMGGQVDLHRANEVRVLTSQLAELAGRHRCAILAVRHLKKAGAEKAIYRGIGSIDIAAAARSILVAAMTPELKHALSHSKSNVGPLGQTLLYELMPPKDKQGVPTFKWAGTSPLTADEINAPAKGPGRPADALKIARDFLHDALREKEMSAAKLKHEAATNGIGWRTLNDAKKGLGVISKKRGREWWWALPGGRE